MAWDLDGDNLAIIDEKTSSVTLWDSLSFKISQINTGIKDHLSIICWSTASGRLAVGSEKGNLVIYNHKTSKKISLLGKHLRRISCAAWNKDNLLALASDDKVISVNSPEGDLLKQNSLRDLPSDLQFAEMKRPESFTGSENSVGQIL
ncbi:hypothetical protein EG68_11135 [Paragonimus skrjabini miyazakii]|uniref:WDR19 first beta-propeller domain-containing protein n=1 Tax=Paragonimus skrjabini miyazakii TaxID=59628 RepID=A0A8S9YK61_9TREM|nr:hypothetical protein EG68_11135 [Paragonimus skrjabini miyazakii]